ncbi:MAG: hypothetical protein WA012_07735 [Rhodoferax sp.]
MKSYLWRCRASPKRRRRCMDPPIIAVNLFQAFLSSYFLFIATQGEHHAH